MKNNEEMRAIKHKLRGEALGILEVLTHIEELERDNKNLRLIIKEYNVKEYIERYKEVDRKEEVGDIVKIKLPEFGSCRPRLMYKDGAILGVTEVWDGNKLNTNSGMVDEGWYVVLERKEN